MDPEYFHRVLTFGEADDFLAGLHRRYRHGYCQARMVADVIGQLFAKNYKSPVFGWEEDERRSLGSKPPTEEELREIMEEARKWEEELNGERKA